jgi:hypothetical protein
MTFEACLYLIFIPILAASCSFLAVAWLIWNYWFREEDTDLERYTRLLKDFGFSELKCLRIDNQLIEKLPPNKYLRGYFYQDWESIIHAGGTANNSFAWMHFDRWGKFIAYGARA